MKTTDIDWVYETFGESGLLSKKIPNYKERDQQVELSKKIQESIREETPLIAEAPTGVGKSLAALVPGFERIRKTDEPVIVVTSSIILQEQYINKDIPMLEDLYKQNVNPVLIKGRNNYLCPKKLNEAKNGKVGFGTSDQVKQFDDVLKWAVQSRKGDKSELDFVPSAAVWSKFACLDSNECTGKQCSFFSVCPYYKERNKVSSSKLVVCNYHYFFTAMGSMAPMLPPKARVIIMDEGHEINAIARDFQERKYSISALKYHFDHLGKAIKKAELSEIGGTVYDFLGNLELDVVNATLFTLFAQLKHEYKIVVNKHYTRDFWQLEIPQRTRLQPHADEHIQALMDAAEACYSYMNKFGFSGMEDIPMVNEMYGEDAVEWLVQVYRFRDLLSDRITFLQHFFAYEDNLIQDGDDIFWIQEFNDGVSIHAKPLTGAGLTEGLFRKSEEGPIPIVMSATLAASESFDHAKSDLGIQEGKAQELIVSSPFNLDENILWYLPPNTPAGNEPGHLSFTLNEMLKVIEELEGRTLCLFTSNKNLKIAQEHFRKILPSYINVISQDEWPKQKIIDYMKKHDNTVVLGTKSFYTGVDIQGHHLSAVLMDKFPFPMKGDPINEVLMSQPRGFKKYNLPEAIISMKQGMGRLNRTATDKGVVAIYDGRLATANYKNLIFNSFDFNIQATKDWDRVKSYIGEIKESIEPKNEGGLF